MRKIYVLLIATVWIAMQARAQCGVYLTAGDYINGKLTAEGKVLSIPSGPGPDDRVVVSGKTFMFDKIWGYKNNLSEYRMLDGEPRLIVCKGNIYAFAPYGPIKKRGKKTTYYRLTLGFGQITVTKDLRSTEATTVADYLDLWKVMDPKLIPQVKQYFVKRTEANEGVTPVPEQIINYYNSLLPGYVEPLYDIITVNVDGY
jgi:hypothetical protein